MVTAALDADVPPDDEVYRCVRARRELDAAPLLAREVHDVVTGRDRFESRARPCASLVARGPRGMECTLRSFDSATCACGAGEPSSKRKRTVSCAVVDPGTTVRPVHSWGDAARRRRSTIWTDRRHRSRRTQLGRRRRHPRSRIARRPEFDRDGDQARDDQEACDQDDADGPLRRTSCPHGVGTWR